MNDHVGEYWYRIKVTAAQIVDVTYNDDGTGKLYFSETHAVPVRKMFMRHEQPAPGRYYVLDRRGQQYCVDEKEFRSCFFPARGLNSELGG